MQRAELKQHDNVRNEEDFEVNTQKLEQDPIGNVIRRQTDVKIIF